MTLIPSRKEHLVTGSRDEPNHELADRLADIIDRPQPKEWSADRIAREYAMQTLFADKNYTRKQALIGLQIVSSWSWKEAAQRMVGKCAEEIRWYAMEWEWE